MNMGLGGANLAVHATMQTAKSFSLFLLPQGKRPTDVTTLKFALWEPLRASVFAFGPRPRNSGGGRRPPAAGTANDVDDVDVALSGGDTDATEHGHQRRQHHPR